VTELVVKRDEVIVVEAVTEFEGLVELRYEGDAEFQGAGDKLTETLLERD